MKITAKLAAATFGAVAFSSAAFAGYVTPPGERAGVDLASPLPEGIYFVNLAGSVGGDRRFSDPTAALNFDVPVLVWSTPWTILGGRLELIGAAPIASLGLNRTGLYIQGFYNPFFAASLNWNVGNGFSVGIMQGGYIPMDSGELGTNGATNHGALDEQLMLAWHGGGWNATANIHYNIVFNQEQAGPAPGGAPNSNAFIYDLGLTKTIGKWEVGAVAFGSATNHTTWTVNGVTTLIDRGASQFALGGLVGYNFGPVIAQAYLTSDVYANGYVAVGQKQNYETRLWTRLIVPLWNPEAPKAVVAKY